MRDFVTLKNRTDKSVSFTYGGETVTIKSAATHIVDTEVARFLFSNDQVLGLRQDAETGDKIAAYKLGIENGPNSLLETLEADVFDCAPFEPVAFHEHPDLAASRQVKLQKVAADPSDFRMTTVAVR